MVSVPTVERFMVGDPPRWAEVRFRSRLESRWAIVFHALGFQWEYEPKRFRLPGGRYYTPDFRLPDLALWVEIKPYAARFQPGSSELISALDRLSAVGDLTKERTALLIGQPSLSGFAVDAYYASGHCIGGAGLPSGARVFLSYLENQKPFSAGSPA